MGCVFSKKNNTEIKIVDLIDKDEKFNYLQRKGTLILRMDSIYNVLKIGIQIGWDYGPRLKKHFLMMERTPTNFRPNSFSSGYASNVSLDMIH